MQVNFLVKGILTLVLVVSLLPRSAAYQKDKLFADQVPLDMEMDTNIKFLKNSESDTVFFSSWLKFKDSAGNPDSIPVDLRARGNSRRAQCFFPPLWLKIPNGEAKNTIFQGNRSLKLVLPCQEGENYNHLAVKEYVIYKLYEEISPYYFRTRLVNLTLIDRQNKKAKSYSLNAFVLEDIDQVAKNYQAKQKKTGLVLPHLINDTLALSQDFFAFMIGNTDWSNTTQHNVRMLDIGNGMYVPVAYDFDYSGFVNAPYALPYDYLPIKNVTERLYRGICRNPELTEWVRAYYLQKETQLLKILDENRIHLSNSEFDSARAYLSGFFDILKNDLAFQSQMIGSCQQYETPAARK
ncbi:hypothetical protein D0X99_02550 [Algoriphagus lacus]|uniref:Uncharacterized protein n=1 Tax=Algoriphagus lacus TaxID=2056311 RepID=A0A418PWY7_9BACT|nr:hypothetical protein D0X99_02550 [Algoriphagus lacus]